MLYSEIERLQKIIGKQAIEIEVLKKNRGVIRNKVGAVKELVKEGFTIKDACFGLGISRSRYYELLSKKSAEDVGDKQREKKKESELNETNRAILRNIPYGIIGVLLPVVS